MQNDVLGCEVKVLTEFQRTDSVSRHVFYDTCEVFHFSFRLSEIKYKLGSYSDTLRKAKALLANSQRCQAGKWTSSIRLDILKDLYILLHYQK